MFSHTHTHYTDNTRVASSIENLSLVTTLTELWDELELRVQRKEVTHEGIENERVLIVSTLDCLCRGSSGHCHEFAHSIGLRTASFFIRSWYRVPHLTASPLAVMSLLEGVLTQDRYVLHLCVPHLIMYVCVSRCR